MNSMFGSGVMPVCEGLKDWHIEQAMADAKGCCRFELARLDILRSRRMLWALQRFIAKL